LALAADDADDAGVIGGALSSTLLAVVLEVLPALPGLSLALVPMLLRARGVAVGAWLALWLEVLLAIFDEGSGVVAAGRPEALANGDVAARDGWDSPTVSGSQATWVSTTATVPAMRDSAAAIFLVWRDICEKVPDWLIAHFCPTKLVRMSRQSWVLLSFIQGNSAT
jgi:hypothetical protein